MRGGEIGLRSVFNVKRQSELRANSVEEYEKLQNTKPIKVEEDISRRGKESKGKGIQTAIAAFEKKYPGGINVNTIIGEPIETSNNIIIIPISKVGFGFASGGSEFSNETVNEYTKKDKDEQIQYKLPFGGGSGARS